MEAREIVLRLFGKGLWEPGAKWGRRLHQCHRPSIVEDIDDPVHAEDADLFGNCRGMKEPLPNSGFLSLWPVEGIEIVLIEQFCYHSAKIVGW
jgi:hypothetical protein